MKTLPFDQMGTISFLKAQGNVFARVTERLSSGMKINNAADDPAGLSLHSSFRARIHGIEAAIHNVEDAISMFNLQDSVMSETHDKLMRIRDLAVRASNEAVLRNDCADRTRLNNEVRELKKEIKRTAETTAFNTKKVLVGNPIKEISVENVNIVVSGSHPTWTPGGDSVAFESDRTYGQRYPNDPAWRIWSRDLSSGNWTLETPDPDNAPKDIDGDGFVDHPLSDPDDGDPDFPGGADADGDGWPDPIDPFPADPNWPANAVDADGDGYISHPDIDPDDTDPGIPMYVRTDSDGDGYVNHPWMDLDYSDRTSPDVYFDYDGDGIPDLVDFRKTDPLMPLNPPDSDGDGEIDLYDPWPSDGTLTAAAPPDADGDGWPTALDPDDGDPAAPGGAPPDADGDGVIDLYDPWPADAIWNPANPIDTDGDGIYDPFDKAGGVSFANDPTLPLVLPDTDGDGAYDYVDPDPLVHNDSDGDGIIDSLDPRPADPNYPISTRAPGGDADSDGYPDDVNGYFDPDPTSAANPRYLIRDFDNDGWPDLYDPFPTDATIPGAGVPPDVDGDGFIDHPLFDPDYGDPLVPFDKFTDADGDMYPWYIDGGPGDPASDDNNYYLPLTHICWEDRNPEYGGSGLVFSSNRNTPYTSAADPWVSDIFIMNGTQPTAVTDDPELDEQPTWSADGSYLVWRREGTDLYYANMSTACAAGTAAPTSLTDGTGAQVTGDDPVFDPNGNRVYYSTGGEIWFTDLMNGTPAPLMDEDGNTVMGDTPDFSPGGDMLWYARGGSTYAFDMSRLREIEITGITANAELGDWSSSGDRITYEAGGRIYTADVVVEYETVQIQAGPDNSDSDWFEIMFPDARIGSLGIGTLSVASQDSAEAAIDMVDTAIERVSDKRADVGIQYKRAVKTLNDLYTQRTNIMAAASSIGDADVAQETTELARANILSSNAISVAAQGADINRNQSLNLLYDNLAKLGL